MVEIKQKNKTEKYSNKDDTRAHTYETQKWRHMLSNKTSIINTLSVSNHNDHSTQ